ncbi:hypothetical protein [Pedobacter sp. SYSU D00535]|nr:hypothetical protein [Pedobacter sp. SYSU D00535]
MVTSLQGQSSASFLTMTAVGDAMLLSMTPFYCRNIEDPSF